MLAFFDFCEANYQAMEDELEPAETALAMFEDAKSSVAADSIYAERLALIDNFPQRAPEQGRSTWSGARAGHESAHRLGTSRANRRRRQIRRRILGPASRLVGDPAARVADRRAADFRDHGHGRLGSRRAESVLCDPLRRAAGRKVERHRDEARRPGDLVWRCRRDPARYRLAQLLPDRRQSMRARWSIWIAARTSQPGSVGNRRRKSRRRSRRIIGPSKSGFR